MKSSNMRRLLIVYLLTLLSFASYSQDTAVIKKNIDLTAVEHTSLKTQNGTELCWTFSAISFLESEIIRKYQLELDLSEKYVSRVVYYDKAQKYIEQYGAAVFRQGGSAHDVINAVSTYGIVPEKEYLFEQAIPAESCHGELVSAVKGMLDGINEYSKGEGEYDFNAISPNYDAAVNSVLDVYLDKAPQKFVYNSVEYTPLMFNNKFLKITPEDYVGFMSFAHKTYFKKSLLSIPDNWSFEQYYNLPIDDVLSIVDAALENDYSCVWSGDLRGEVESDMKRLNMPEEYNNVNMEQLPELREANFRSRKLMDQHLMHIVGRSVDEDGNLYYKMKDSAWGIYIYVAREYFALSTMSIYLNKDGVPKEIRKKLE